MAVTYTKVPASVPSDMRTSIVHVTNIDAGSPGRVDLRDVLGRPARGVKILLTDTSDTSGIDYVDYRINSLVRAGQFNESSADGVVKIWSQADGYAVFRSTGPENEIESVLKVDSLEFVGISRVDTGTNVDIVVW